MTCAPSSPRPLAETSGPGSPSRFSSTGCPRRSPGWWSGCSGSTRWSSPAASGKTAPSSVAWCSPGWVSSAWPRTSRPTPTTAGTPGAASAWPGPVLALVVPTDEELLIARDTARVIAGGLTGSRSAPQDDVMTADLAGRAYRRWRWSGQDLPRAGAGPGPAGRERRLRQAGGSAPPRRRPRPLGRAGRGHSSAVSAQIRCPPPTGAAARSRRARRRAREDHRCAGSRSMTAPMSSWSRPSPPARPGCTPVETQSGAGSSAWTPTSCWSQAGRRLTQAAATRAAADTAEDPIAGTVENLAETLAITASGFWSGEHARVVGCVVNGVPEGRVCGGTAG